MRDAIDLRNDALNHIARVAKKASRVTKRLHFIAARAECAQLGQVWRGDVVTDYPLKDNARMAQRYKEQRDQARGQRDLLLVALKRAAHWQNHYMNCFGQGPVDCVSDYNAALEAIRQVEADIAAAAAAVEAERGGKAEQQAADQ